MGEGAVVAGECDGDVGGGGAKAHTKVWVSTTTHPPPPPTLSIPSPKNLLRFYEKREITRTRQIRKTRGTTGTRQTRKTRGTTGTMETRGLRELGGLHFQNSV